MKLILIISLLLAHYSLGINLPISFSRPSLPLFSNKYLQRESENVSQSSEEMDNIPEDIPPTQKPAPNPNLVGTIGTTEKWTLINPTEESSTGGSDVEVRGASSDEHLEEIPEPTLIPVTETILTSRSPETKEDYERKLASVLENIRKILPALVQLQENMTDLLVRPSEGELLLLEEIPVVESSKIKTAVVEDIPHSFQDFSFIPQPNLTAPIDREYVRNLLNSLISHGNSFENLTKIIQTISPESQLIAYDELNDVVMENAKKEGRLDILEMSCLLFGKPRLDSITVKNIFYAQTIFPLFFQGERTISLEARTRSDGIKNFYFDRKKIHFGISDDKDEIAELGVYFQWKFLPVKDGSCHFLLVDSDSNFLVGVDVTRSEKSPLLAKFILGVASLDDGQSDYKFQWKIHIIRTKDQEQAFILLANRETHLAVEWAEDEEVILNAVDFTSDQQLWNF